MNYLWGTPFSPREREGRRLRAFPLCRLLRLCGRLRPGRECRVPLAVDQQSEEAQVDYGDGPMVRDPQTGKYRRTRLFVLTLVQSQVDPAAGVPLQFSDLGRAA